MRRQNVQNQIFNAKILFSSFDFGWIWAEDLGNSSNILGFISTVIVNIQFKQKKLLQQLDQDV